MTRRCARRAFVAERGFFLILLVWVCAGSGCFSREAKIPPPPPAAVTPWQPPVAAEKAEAAPAPAAGTPQAEEAPPAKAAEEDAATAAGEPPAPVPEAAGPAAPAVPKEAPPAAAAETREPPHHAPESRPAGQKAPHPAAAHAAAPRPSPPAHAAEEPAWAKRQEVLVYRIGFLGMTVGYARFSYMGKTMLRGREAYRLNVQAWTTGILTLIYRGETIDYYLDTHTLAPLQQEFTNRENKRDDVAIYDQESGRIVYRYKDTGEIHKQVEVTPNVYDPVSVTYYFRARDLGEAERPRPVYAGRKLWEISSRLVGRETIDTIGGQVDTVVIRPVIRREGKVEDKGDLKLWMSSDPRHVPVRLFAKFKKIRVWTLVAELMPPREGG